MFRNRNLDRVRDLFADQFEPSGDGFLYRKSMKGAPIPVSRDERERFDADFHRRLRKLMWFVTVSHPGVFSGIGAAATNCDPST